MTRASDEATRFAAHRGALIGLAYRMLEAEDVVQDAYLRWHAADNAAIEQPRRYLGTVVTRLCLDRMKSARAQREIYVGPWLPEPVVDERFDEEAAGELAHDISACPCRGSHPATDHNKRASRPTLSIFPSELTRTPSNRCP